MITMIDIRCLIANLQSLHVWRVGWSQYDAVPQITVPDDSFPTTQSSFGSPKLKHPGVTGSKVIQLGRQEQHIY
jgi:hypothetical protein